MRPIWIPDTSGINRVADDADSIALIAGLKAGFHVRLSFTSISEVISTAAAERRRRLVDVCRQLLRPEADCVDPPNEILRKLVARFEASPASFDWRYVHVDFPPAHEYICRGGEFDEQLATEEREDGKAREKSFRQAYAAAKAEFDRLADKNIALPTNVAETVTLLQSAGAFWRVARNWYDRAAGRTGADDAAIHRFYEVCEPFRALMVALSAALYERCVRPNNEARSLRVGCKDTFMAIYLPYCDQFITRDDRQRLCYLEVAATAGTGATLRSYEEFRDSLVVSIPGN